MNFKYALRSIGKNPLVTAIAIVSLGLGIGANTAIFSLIDQLLIRMLPVENPRQLVQLAAHGPHSGANWDTDAMSYPMYRDFRDKTTVFSGVLARFSTPLSLGYGGRTERTQGELVSGMREVGILMLSGIAIAIPAYIALARYLRSQLYGIEPGDPLSIGAAAALLLAIGLIAGYIPSRRAVRVDPIQVLRYE